MLFETIVPAPRSVQQRGKAAFFIGGPVKKRMIGKRQEEP